MEHTSESAAASVAALSLSAGASSEALVEALTEHAPVSVFITDAEGACVYANARACALTGLTAPESLGFGWTTALHPDDAERVTAEWTRAAASGADFEMEYRFLHTDGGVAWCEATASAVRDRHGALVGWVGVCVDVTARKASEERYQELFENAHDVIYSADVSGNFLAVNKAAVDLLGFTRDELLTMNFFERIAPEEAEGTQEALVRALDGEEAETGRVAVGCEGWASRACRGRRSSGRRERSTHPIRGDRPGHDRPRRVAGPACFPGVPRSADRASEPCALPRPAESGARPCRGGPDWEWQ